MILEYLKEIDIFLNGSAVNSDIYEELSWIGLQGTDAYKNAIKDGEITEIDIIKVNNDELSKGFCN